MKYGSFKLKNVTSKLQHVACKWKHVTSIYDKMQEDDPRRILSLLLFSAI